MAARNFLFAHMTHFSIGPRRPLLQIKFNPSQQSPARDEAQGACRCLDRQFQEEEKNKFQSSWCPSGFS